MAQRARGFACVKRTYTTKAEARRAARRCNADPAISGYIEAYKCPIKMPGKPHYHIGHALRHGRRRKAW